MNDFDDDLGHDLARSLGDAAGGLEANTDWDDLGRRIARSDRARRRGLLAGALALTVLAGAGGFVVGDRRGDDEVNGPATSQAADGDASFDEHDADPAPTKPAVGVVPARLAFRRLSTDGTELRVWRRGTGSEQTTPGVVPLACRTPDDVEIDTSTRDVVGVVNHTLENTVEVGASLRAGIDGAVRSGIGESTPLIVVVQSGKAAKVSVRFADGSTDAMVPVDGLAVLSGSSAAATATDRTTGALSSTGITVTATAANGVTTTVPWIDDVLAGRPSRADVDCTPVLPEAGPDQPSDPAGSRTAIIEAYSTLYDASISDKSLPDLIDDPRGVADAFARAKAGQFATQVSNTRFRFVDMVFRTPDRAVVKFDIELPPDQATAVASNQFGEAVRTGGRWKVTRATICNSLGLVGASCDSPSTDSTTDPTTDPTGPTTTAVPGAIGPTTTQQGA